VAAHFASKAATLPRQISMDDRRMIKTAMKSPKKEAGRQVVQRTDVIPGYRGLDRGGRVMVDLPSALFFARGPSDRRIYDRRCRHMQFRAKALDNYATTMTS
jgi:hypothetical protein